MALREFGSLEARVIASVVCEIGVVGDDRRHVDGAAGDEASGCWRTGRCR
jgi:hypothetical protein